MPSVTDSEPPRPSRDHDPTEQRCHCLTRSGIPRPPATASVVGISATFPFETTPTQPSTPSVVGVTSASPRPQEANPKASPSVTFGRSGDSQTLGATTQSTCIRTRWPGQGKHRLRGVQSNRVPPPSNTTQILVTHAPQPKCVFSSAALCPKPHFHFSRKSRFSH